MCEKPTATAHSTAQTNCSAILAQFSTASTTAAPTDTFEHTCAQKAQVHALAQMAPTHNLCELHQLSIGDVMNHDMATRTVNKKSSAGSRRTVAVLFSVLCMSSIYAEDQADLEQFIHKQIHVGMTREDAVATLTDEHFSCHGTAPLTCARTKQSLLPSSCIERVNLTVSSPGDVVQAVDVKKTVCAGL